MKMRNVVVHGEDVFHLLFIWEDVNHPREYHGQERSSFRVAAFFRVDRTEHAERAGIELAWRQKNPDP